MKILKCHLSRFSFCRESLGDPERDLLQVPDLRYLFANETRCPGTFLSLVSWLKLTPLAFLQHHLISRMPHLVKRVTDVLGAVVTVRNPFENVRQLAAYVMHTSDRGNMDITSYQLRTMKHGSTWVVRFKTTFLRTLMAKQTQISLLIV
jgi:hypothetical protein